MNGAPQSVAHSSAAPSGAHAGPAPQPATDVTTAVYPLDPDSLLTDADAARAAGRRFAETYQSAEPYNHICIDGFLPEAVLRRVRADVATLDRGKSEASFTRAQENLKSSYIPERLPTYTRNLFYAFNSRPFIQFLEQMTGIKGLIPDPYFQGAGIHRTENGGHLDIHADFNLNKAMNVERRLNTLIYLNDDWREEWGGCFEIWDKQMTRQVKKFAPTFNRMVTFSTGSDTFHGNPEPVNHPNGEPRLSIALYYYTATWDPSRKAHSTLFAPRPGSVDEVDRRTRRRAALQEALPPAIYRRVIHRLGRFGF
jgi:Rps23 Pro-64 3,4-dihydroxylase Tpa1-like proline 4-hydroxylase